MSKHFFISANTRLMRPTELELGDESVICVCKSDMNSRISLGFSSDR